MRITVRLFASLRIGRFEEKVLETPAGARVRAVVEEVGLPAAGLGILLVNGLHAHLDDELCPGDAVHLFPLVGGG